MSLAIISYFLSASVALGMRRRLPSNAEPMSEVICENITSYDQCDSIVKLKCPDECKKLETELRANIQQRLAELLASGMSSSSAIVEAVRQASAHDSAKVHESRPKEIAGERSSEEEGLEIAQPVLQEETEIAKSEKEATVERDDDSPPPLEEFDTEKALQNMRAKYIRHYMQARVKAFQITDPDAKEIALEDALAVLKKDVFDGTFRGPEVDLQSALEANPARARHVFGSKDVRWLLERPPRHPCFIKPGSISEPEWRDGEAVVKYVIRLGTSVVGRDVPHQAIFSFDGDNPLIQKVTVIGE